MRVCYDHQIFSSQNYGGISRYFAELFRAYKGDPDMSMRVPLWFSDNHYLDGLGVTQHRSALGGRKFKARLTVLDRVNRLASLSALRRGDFDLFHPTYYRDYFLDRLRGRPFVLTVYDMIHEIYPELYMGGDPVAAWKRALIPKAARIIAISEHTKKDILRFYDVPADRIDVIHLANSLRAPETGPEALPEGVPARYILFVGNRGAYKNFSRLARAVAPLFENDPDLHLVCAGGGPLSPAEGEELRGLGLLTRAQVRSADDATLFRLYRHARVFVFPSQYEGFGIPVLEAFAAGCPMALSAASSLPEVAGDAGRYFDPGDEASIRAAVAALLDDETARAGLIAKGRERLKAFTWAETAEKTKAAYARA